MPDTIALAVGSYEPPQPFRTVKRTYPCQHPGCGKPIPYKHGRPPNFCSEHRGLRHNQPAPSAIELAAARLLPTEIVAFLRREGIASYTNRVGWNAVLTPWGAFDAHRELEVNIAAALAAEPA